MNEGIVGRRGGNDVFFVTGRGGGLSIRRPLSRKRHRTLLGHFRVRRHLGQLLGTEDPKNEEKAEIRYVWGMPVPYDGQKGKTEKNMELPCGGAVTEPSNGTERQKSQKSNANLPRC